MEQERNRNVKIKMESKEEFLRGFEVESAKDLIAV